MSATLSRPFTFTKFGVFNFSRRIAKELKHHYSSPRIGQSLRTKSPRVAAARARKAADLPGHHMLRMGQAVGGSSTAP
ncbi:DUF6538 domain-containing protein [Marivita sp.]|uniref:DUF6538 domain-containing protein n=1 Tax=Marivita sp. TaxID=2003365 RepID=UPI00345CD997